MWVRSVKPSRQGVVAAHLGLGGDAGLGLGLAHLLMEIEIDAAVREVASGGADTGLTTVSSPWSG